LDVLLFASTSTITVVNSYNSYNSYWDSHSKKKVIAENLYVEGL